VTISCFQALILIETLGRRQSLLIGSVLEGVCGTIVIKVGIVTNKRRSSALLSQDLLVISPLHQQTPRSINYPPPIRKEEILSLRLPFCTCSRSPCSGGRLHGYTWARVSLCVFDPKCVPSQSNRHFFS